MRCGTDSSTPRSRTTVPQFWTRELIGIDNLMWGSDCPHVDSTWPCSLAVLDEIFADVPDDDRAKITYENVTALYRL